MPSACGNLSRLPRFPEAIARRLRHTAELLVQGDSDRLTLRRNELDGPGRDQFSRTQSLTLFDPAQRLEISLTQLSEPLSGRRRSDQPNQYEMQIIDFNENGTWRGPPYYLGGPLPRAMFFRARQVLLSRETF